MKMKRIAFALSLFLVFSVQAARLQVPPQNIYGRSYQSLNGMWSYIVDQQEVGDHSHGYARIEKTYGLDRKMQNPEDLIEYDFDASPKMKIPSDWNTADEKLFFYEGVVWFRHLFDAKLPPNRQMRLCFGAVNYAADVYLNGTFLGSHIGGFTPFAFDVTNLLKEKGNSLVVKVDNRRQKSAIPTIVFDWWNYGGITRDVLLVDQPLVTVEDYSLALTKGKTDSLTFSAKLNVAATKERVRVTIPELKIERTFETTNDGSVMAEIPAKVTLWCPENPKLYAVTIEASGERVTDQIGFRTIATKGKQILLNGKPIFLRGISLHDEKAYTAGRMTTTKDAETVLQWAKELGCNFVRLAHYTHNELTVRAAERMGLLLWEEIPAYWVIDWTNPETLENAKAQLRDMIRRDHNRAATIIWSIANETPHGEARDRFLGTLATYARSLDQSRLISMAMEVTSAQNFVNRLDDNMNVHVDVVSFNQYIGWYRDVDVAPKMRWEIPYNKPVIISEMGGGAIAGRHGEKNQRWTEEFLDNLYRQNFIMLDKIEGLAGVSPWILKDFMSPRRPLYGTQNYFNRKGLVSDQGVKKLAFETVRAWYEKKTHHR